MDSRGVIAGFGAEGDVIHQSVGIGLEPPRFIRRYGLGEGGSVIRAWSQPLVGGRCLGDS